jgi:drug/metabolite transporter (DMT)-like permease
LIVLSIAGYTGAWRQINTRHMGTHVMRNTAHFAGQNLWFFAVTAIPLAQVFAIEFTSPLWVIVLSPLMLGERLTRMRLGAALVGFIGV